MGGPQNYGGSDDGMITFHTQNGYVVSSTPPERMRITGAGNVGIGTTSPGYKLDIRGNQDDSDNFLFNGLNIVNTTNQGGVPNKTAIRLGITSDSGVRAAKVVAIEDGNNTHNVALAFYTNNTNADDSSAERMRITSGGNVEINTGSIKTGEPDTGYGRAAFKIGSRQSGSATGTGGYIPISIDGTVYFINLFTSTP
jgi:hypothetical protein